MRKCWPLLDEAQFQKVGSDWLLLLLTRVGKLTGEHILLTLWRAWHLQNDVIHGDGNGSVTASASFLVNYGESLLIVSYSTQAGASDRGKGKIGETFKYKHLGSGKN
jgi:hypothetical protein